MREHNYDSLFGLLLTESHHNQCAMTIEWIDTGYWILHTINYKRSILFLLIFQSILTVPVVITALVMEFAFVLKINNNKCKIEK